MDMLRNITTASAAASNPLLKSLLGPSASPEEYRAMAEEAENIWKMMDEMADSDPEAYRAFVADAAKAAREEAESKRDPHVEGLAPALVLEAQAQQQQGGGVRPVMAEKEGGGSGNGSGPEALTRVVAGGQAVALVHIWAANDASGVAPPHVAGQPVTPQQSAWSGLVVPVAEYKPATSRPGPLLVHHFHVAVHAAAVRLCVSGQPPAFRAALLEAVSQFVEAQYRLQLSRTVRTLQVHREAATETELQDLLRQQEEHLRAAASHAAGPGDDTAAGSEPPLSKGLLEELRTLGTAPARQQQQQQKASASATVSAGRPQAPKKALIEELD